MLRAKSGVRSRPQKGSTVVIGTLEIVRTTLAVEYPTVSVSFMAGALLRDIYGPGKVMAHVWTEDPALRKLKFINSADLIECLTILAEGK